MNSDDPSFFGAELNDEYRNLQRFCRLSPAQLVELMANAIHSSFAPPELKQQLLQVLPDPSAH